MIDVFSNALFSNPPIVLGRRLRPYSLAHNFALKTIRSPIISGEDWTRSDLLTACWICRMDLDEIRSKVFADEPDQSEVAAWSSLLFDEPDETWDEGYKCFVDYVSAYCEVPDRLRSGDDKSIKHPWEFFIAVRLAGVKVVNHIDDAWNMACNLAHSYHSAWSETQGDESLVTEEDLNPSRTLSVADLMGAKNGD